ncbi:MAG: glycosyltransferase family 4 protein [Microthrixaceae bacterium]
MIAAVAELGEVDVFLLGDASLESDVTPPPNLHLGRVGYAPRATRRLTRLERLAGLAPVGAPAAVRQQADDAARRAFSEWVDGTYDLAWFVRIESWLALGPLVDAPAIIDYDDLRDHLARSRLRSHWPDPPEARRPMQRARAALRAQLVASDANAWRRLQQRTAPEVAAVVVCSELDRARLGVPNAAIVPNGVDLPLRPVGHSTVGEPPTLCLHGSLGYGPNGDAARILVRDVLPALRRDVPDAHVRLVGRTNERVDRLGQSTGVTVTGPVDDIVAELARADVVAVPLREGAGTRIKVLEAFAHRIPVVATGIAVEGLDVVDGEHVLVADTPAAFASSCARLLRDEDLRARLMDAAEALVRRRYGWDQARRAASTLATEVTRSGR